MATFARMALGRDTGPALVDSGTARSWRRTAPSAAATRPYGQVSGHSPRPLAVAWADAHFVHVPLGYGATNRPLSRCQWMIRRAGRDPRFTMSRAWGNVENRVAPRRPAVRPQL